MTRLSGRLSLDLETGTRTLFKRKGSPFHPENKIIAAGWQLDSGPIAHRYSRTGIEDGLLADLLHDLRPKVLRGVNIKFDLLHLLYQKPLNYSAYQDWVCAGGMLWDAQLAEYLLDCMVPESHMLSMDEIAPRYGGNTKVDEVKELWNAGVQTEDIDSELLIRYLVGGKDETGTEQLGDIGNTTLICDAQIARAQQVGQYRSILLNMGSLLGSVEMELNGVFADKAKGIELAEDLAVQVQAARAELAQYLPPDLPFEFNWGSVLHKSALIFGGTVMYPAKEYVHEDGSGTLCAEFGPGHKPLTYYTKEVEEPVLDEAGEPVRYKSGKRAGEAKTRKVKVPDIERGPKTRNCEAPYVFPGYTTPNKEWESSRPGVYSVSSDVVEELGTRDIPFLKALSKLQALTKDLGTYFIVTDSNGESKGMLTLVGDDGIIHHGINHCSTVTGRFSASSPNLQNTPKGNKSKVKEVFVSRYPGGSIVQSDFSALEVYVQAWLTGAASLLADLHAGKDMHCARLAVKERMPYDEVYALCKGDKYSKEWGYKRTAAKMVSFQLAYGAGAAKIAASTGLPVAEVEAFIKVEDEANPEVAAYFEGVTEEIKRTRKPTGKVVPHPLAPSIMVSLGRGTSRTPDGKVYAYTESPSPEYLLKKRVFSTFSPTQVKNYSVQGMGAEVMKAAMWLAVRAFYATRNFNGRAVIINTVHDAQYVDSAPDVLDDAFATVHEAMAQATGFLRNLFKWEIQIDVPSDTSYGPSMAVENKFSPAEQAVAEARLRVSSTIAAILSGR